jgi:medium-chain acyl-[acyl-carrier-protein] hydrolase
VSETHKEKEGKPLLWRGNYQVQSYDVDLKKEQTLMSLCNYFQESAWRHAERCDLGYMSLAEKGQFWVLSRLLVEIDRYPRWQDHISIETWSKGADGLFAVRDFIVYDGSGTGIIRATSGWLIVDTAKRRPQRLHDFSTVMPFMRDRHALTHRLQKLPAATDPEIQSAFSVRFSDLDLNNHVNSTKYIEWIIDSFPFAFLSVHTVKSFEINFLAESLFGDEIEIHRGKNPQKETTFLVDVKRKGDNREFCRAQLCFTRTD